MVKPFSQNIIFMDTEFTDLDIRKGELLSIGLVKNTGEQLYIELDYQGPSPPWVEKNVLPTLTAPKISKQEARTKLAAFIDNQNPYMVAYVNQFDAVFWYDLFGTPQNHPFYWIPIDFASILFAHGYDPNSMGHHKFLRNLGIDETQYNKHHALDDAIFLRDVYNAFYKKTGK